MKHYPIKLSCFYAWLLTGVSVRSRSSRTVVRLMANARTVRYFHTSQFYFIFIEEIQR